MKCEVCGKERPSKTIPLCPKCAKSEKAREFVSLLHENLDVIGGGDCGLCSNMCRLDDVGLCKIRRREGEKVISLSSKERALLHAYYDPLPTNCCNAWFCEGSKLKGYNLAVFYYGCNFDCLYCQNWEHKFVERARVFTVKDLLGMINERVKCVCHFGGSPEPQMDFALNFSEIAYKEFGVMICWEWNGAGNRSKALKAAELSSVSNGTVKFDLKAWNENLHLILTGRSNEEVLKNFEAIFERYPEVLSATTLLVPYYVDAEEVRGIASFLASLSEEIPYSLLVFHPDYRLRDLPVTPKEQVYECYRVARRYLKRVNIGNIFLIL